MAVKPGNELMKFNLTIVIKGLNIRAGLCDKPDTQKTRLEP